MTVVLGLLSASGAAIAFGVQYVPVKKYEIYDGTTFQWFMCNGILFVGILTAVAFQQLENGCPLEVVFGGVLWGISNYLVLPLVKLLGIGLGFSMYHFVNLCVGYCTGRFGLFGVPCVEEVFEGSLFICDAGCVMILLSFVAMIFVEQDHSTVRQAAVESELPPPIVAGIDREYREMYHRWRQGESRGSRDERVGMIKSFSTTSISSGHCFSNGGFGMYATPSLVLGDELVQKLINPRDIGPVVSEPNGEIRSPISPRTVSDPAVVTSVSAPDVEANEAPESATPEATPRGWMLKIIGVLLALAGGGTCGVQSVPATLYNNAHPSASPAAVVFPQCIGIWLVSTLIYLLYSTVARIAGWKVPHSSIRPAFFSGGIWALGFALMISGIRDLGYSVGYTLDAVGPILVSSLFSIFVFKEITDRRQLIIYGAAELLQLIGVVLIASFGKQS